MNPKLIQALPKTDLHVHLDGSLRLATLIELAREQKITLPSYTTEGLTKLVFKERYQSLEDYLRGFQYTVAVMQTKEALERVAYELALDSMAEGVCYIEPRFAPQLHINADLNLDEVLKAVDRGLKRAQKEINAEPEIVSGQRPPLAYGLIGSGLRMFTPQFSAYYRWLSELHPDLPQNECAALASLDLVRGLIRLRDEESLPIVGLDLAGTEKGYPAEEHRQAFDLAHKNFLKKTIHAGEAYGASSIFQAITDCYADRIGHGTHLFDANLVPLSKPADRQRYVEALWHYIADRRITIEICLTSNLQTTPNIKDMAEHPFRQMLDNRLSVSICTDNRLISNTSVSREIELALKNFNLSSKQLKDIIIYGFKRSFFPGTYQEKRRYIRQVIDYYEKVEKTGAKTTLECKRF